MIFAAGCGKGCYNFFFYCCLLGSLLLLCFVFQLFKQVTVFPWSPIYVILRMPPLTQGWRRLFITHCVALNDYISLQWLVVHPALLQGMNLKMLRQNPMEVVTGTEMLSEAPSGSQASWSQHNLKGLGRSLSSLWSFLLRPGRRLQLLLGWLFRFIFTCSLCLLSPIIPQDQAFCFVIKTFQTLSLTDANKSLVTAFSHRFWTHCWLLFKVIIQGPPSPKFIHSCRSMSSIYVWHDYYLWPVFCDFV